MANQLDNQAGTPKLEFNKFYVDKYFEYYRSRDTDGGILGVKLECQNWNLINFRMLLLRVYELKMKVE